MIHPIDEFNIRQSTPRRYQVLAKAWTKKWEAPLKHTQKLLRLWASGFYDSGYEREHLINLIDRGVFTIVPYLVEGNPEVLVETKIPSLRPFAFTTQLALNFLIDKADLAETVFIPASINSMFGGSHTRVINNYDRIISLENEVIKVGHPVVVVIEDADYIGDPAAKRYSDFILEGDVYKLPTDYAKDLFARKDKFGNQIADYILPDCKLVTKYSAEAVSSPDFDYNKLSLRSYSTFIDIYNRDEGVIQTIMPEGHKAVILKEMEYDGPGKGPYDHLAYKYFPGTPIGLPPAWAWHDLDVTMNILAKTAREQAESQKTITVVDPAGKDTGKKIVEGKNMDVVVAENPDLVKALQLGGVNPDNYTWMAFAEGAFTKTGAYPVLSGQESTAPTYGQEKMVFANASRVIDTMYNRFHNFMVSILKKFAWGVWTDPTVYVPEIIKIPGVGEVPTIFSQADRVGDFYDFVFKIIPYSTQRTSPELKYQKTMLFATQWLLPTMQLANSQGAKLDIPEVTKILASYYGLDNFAQYFKSAVPTQLEMTPPFVMQPSKSKSKSKNRFGQMSDAFGATTPSRESNLAQAETRQETKVE